MESNPFTEEGGNPFSQGNAADAAMGGQPNPSAVPETTKPRQMPGGDQGGMGGAGMGGPTDPSAVDGGLGQTTDSNVPQDGGKVAHAVVVTDILRTNPGIGTRKASLLADEVVKRVTATTPMGNPSSPMGNLNDPRNPASPLHPNHPMNSQYVAPRGPGGRNLEANPNSQYPFIEDAANRAARWMTHKVKQKVNDFRQRQDDASDADPDQSGEGTPPVPAVAPPAQGPWGTPAPSPAPGSVQTPEPTGWKPRPLPTPGAVPAQQPSTPGGRHARPSRPGRHRASLVYPQKAEG